MSTISVRLSEKEDLLVRNYAKMHSLSVSDLVRASVIEKIEDEIDLKTFDEVLNKMEKTYSLSDVKRELGL
ncbi:MAG: CopG family transcriptional regulator [Eubacteriaceae bacterium]|nr:CopG family transcriptional regulator [Eubacteriaceae bacterium]